MYPEYNTRVNSRASGQVNKTPSGADLQVHRLGDARRESDHRVVCRLKLPYPTVAEIRKKVIAHLIARELLGRRILKGPAHDSFSLFHSYPSQDLDYELEVV